RPIPRTVRSPTHRRWRGRCSARRSATPFASGTPRPRSSRLTNCGPGRRAPCHCKRLQWRLYRRCRARRQTRRALFADGIGHETKDRSPQNRSTKMARKPGARAEFVLFDVLYEDGSQRSNRKVPSAVLGGLDGDAPARTVIEEQDRAIAEKSGIPPTPIKSVRRSGGK